MREKSFFLISVIILVSFSGIYGQKGSFQLGGKLINELTFDNQYAPGIGAQAIYRFGGKSGIETGLYYKIRPNVFPFIPPFSYYYHIEIEERNILLPLLYRFDSRFLNFTIGPVLKYFIGWKVRRNESGVVIKDYTTDRFELISTASISRNFKLTPTWIFEPEIRFSAFVPNGDGGWGLNFSIRKKLH